MRTRIRIFNAFSTLTATCTFMHYGALKTLMNIEQEAFYYHTTLIFSKNGGFIFHNENRAFILEEIMGLIFTVKWFYISLSVLSVLNACNLSVAVCKRVRHHGCTIPRLVYHSCQLTICMVFSLCIQKIY